MPDPAGLTWEQIPWDQIKLGDRILLESTDGKRLDEHLVLQGPVENIGPIEVSGYHTERS